MCCCDGSRVGRLGTRTDCLVFFRGIEGLQHSQNDRWNPEVDQMNGFDDFSDVEREWDEAVDGEDSSSEAWDSEGDDSSDEEVESSSEESDSEDGDSWGEDPDSGWDDDEDSGSYEEDPGEPGGSFGNSGSNDPTAILDVVGRGLILSGKVILDAIDRWVRRRQRRGSDAEVLVKDDDETESEPYWH